jgi:hypothetical protein
MSGVNGTVLIYGKWWQLLHMGSFSNRPKEVACNLVGAPFHGAFSGRHAHQNGAHGFASR